MNSRVAISPDLYPNFKPGHWTDAQIYYKNAKTTELAVQVAKKFNKLTEAVRIKFHESMNPTSMSVGISTQIKDVLSKAELEQSNEAIADIAASHGGDVAEDEQQPEEVFDQIPEDHHVICYGPITIEYIQQAVSESFKLFWDGSVSLYLDTILSAKNNKDVLNTLLETRSQTNDDEEPPVTLLHGYETEKLLRQTLMRIKVE